jgi:hypothetical protein
MEQTDDYFEIRVTHRSLGAGLNEIFVELEAIKQFGNLMKMIYSEETLLLKMQRW